MRRKICGILISITVALTLLFVIAEPSQAMLYSTDTFQLTGKLEAKTAFFTQNAKGNTYPQFEAWDMFKERNILYLQADHDLKALTGLELQYHIVGRAMYEGVYDFGPKVFRQAYDDNKAAFERYNLKWQAGIWEAYVNYKQGPLNLRVGRQNLSWGETDVLRVVDHINPLDNTWGGTGTESLDDRRIPLWMVRVGWQKDPIFGIEGFVVPGAVDATVSPIVPEGSPYAAPAFRFAPVATWSMLGLTPGFNNSEGAVTEPSRDMSSSRVGLKLLSTIFDTNFALTYQRTYWDSAALRFSTSAPDISLFNPGILAIEWQYPKVNVFGLQASHIFTDFDFIVKGDIAHVQGVPVVITDIDQPLTYIPTPIPGLPFAPQATTGQFVYRDFTNFGISMEKQLWIRSINRGNRISFQFEYYGFYCHNWDSRMILGGVPDPVTGEMPQVLRYEQVLDFVITSDWYSKMNLSIATLYDPRGSWSFNPTFTYKFDNPLTIALGYSMTTGNWVSFGIARDRDQVSLLLRYEF